MTPQGTTPVSYVIRNNGEDEKIPCEFPRRVNVIESSSDGLKNDVKSIQSSSEMFVCDEDVVAGTENVILTNLSISPEKSSVVKENSPTIAKVRLCKFHREFGQHARQCLGERCDWKFLCEPQVKNQSPLESSSGKKKSLKKSSGRSPLKSSQKSVVNAQSSSSLYDSENYETVCLCEQDLVYGVRAIFCADAGCEWNRLQRLARRNAAPAEREQESRECVDALAKPRGAMHRRYDEGNADGVIETPLQEAKGAGVLTIKILEVVTEPEQASTRQCDRQ